MLYKKILLREGPKWSYLLKANLCRLSSGANPSAESSISSQTFPLTFFQEAMFCLQLWLEAYTEIWSGWLHSTWPIFLQRYPCILSLTPWHIPLDHCLLQHFKTLIAGPIMAQLGLNQCPLNFSAFIFGLQNSWRHALHITLDMSVFWVVKITIES